MRPSTGPRSSAGFAFVSFVALSQPAFAAADLPPVKVSETNAVAECATPGRLMGFIKARNPKLDGKFDQIAVEYMRHGQDLGLRWDYGFFQMLVETGFLTFTGDVKPDQNNFAGLGTTGGGVRGEKFKDVSSGARAHLEHLAMYSGDKIENPVAERTKNIQEWQVLTKWQKTIQGPMTFSHLAKQWAPKSKGYPSDIKAVADRFMNGVCKDADPNPEMMASLAPASATAAPASAANAKPVTAEGQAEPVLTRGEELAKRANDEARVEGATKSALGAGSSIKIAGTPAAIEAPQVKILNALPAAPEAETAQPVSMAATVTGAIKNVLAPAAKPEPEAKANEAAGKQAGTAASGQCNVFTASYGGENAVIIKATADKVVNYTVLHVNEGEAKREADAYIAAYAKGGETLATEFKTHDQALDKAFELCPEG